MPTEQLTFTVDPGRREGERVYKLNGPLSLTTLVDFQSAVRAETAPAVILDLSGVPYMDSAGLGAVVNAHISCSKAGRQFAIVGMSDRVRTLFQLTKVEKALPIFTSLDEAETRFGKPAEA